MILKDEDEYKDKERYSLNVLRQNEKGYDTQTSLIKMKS